MAINTVITVTGGFNTEITSTENPSLVTEILNSGSVIRTSLASTVPLVSTSLETGSGLIGPKGDGGGKDVNYIASIDISAHKAVSVTTEGKIAYTDVDSIESCRRFLGVSMNASLQGSTVTVRTLGEISDISFALTPDQSVFVTNNGTITTDKPVGAIRYLLIGFSSSETDFYLNSPMLWEEEP